MLVLKRFVAGLSRFEVLAPGSVEEFLAGAYRGGSGPEDVVEPSGSSRVRLFR